MRIRGVYTQILQFSTIFEMQNVVNNLRKMLTPGFGIPRILSFSCSPIVATNNQLFTMWERWGFRNERENSMRPLPLVYVTPHLFHASLCQHNVPVDKAKPWTSRWIGVYSVWKMSIMSSPWRNRWNVHRKIGIYWFAYFYFGNMHFYMNKDFFSQFNEICALSRIWSRLVFQIITSRRG